MRLRGGGRIILAGSRTRWYRTKKGNHPAAADVGGGAGDGTPMMAGHSPGPMRNHTLFQEISVFSKKFDSVQTVFSGSFSLKLYIFAECCGSRREVLRVVMTIVIGNKHDQAADNGALPPLLSLSNVHCFFYFPSNIYLTLNEYHERYHSQGWIAGLLL